MVKQGGYEKYHQRALESWWQLLETIMDDSNKKIYGNSTDDQIKAIEHIGTHARLLAGPGTGKTKTLTRRVLYLILEHKVKPETILLLIFTRLAADQLKEEIEKDLKPLGKPIPQVSTLHSFALKQILHNSGKLSVLPRPIRIADDWEERNIIYKDLQKALGVGINEIRRLINQLSADWNTLEADKAGWEKSFPNLKFLNTLLAHKFRYGETLQSELVYRFKKQLEQKNDFRLDKQYKHIIVDEYQDLNFCDLTVIKDLSKLGAEIFAVGDDDQSIYGFRFASPDGIREFDQFYPRPNN